MKRAAGLPASNHGMLDPAVLFSSESAPFCDAQSILAARAGDRAAFGALYRQYSRMIHGILLAHVSYTEAEDLMQDVFVKAMERIAELREANAFGGWLASIARRAAFDHRRRIRVMDALPDTLSCAERPDGEAFEVLGSHPGASRELSRDAGAAPRRRYDRT